jgi:hypothetical protein
MTMRAAAVLVVGIGMALGAACSAGSGAKGGSGPDGSPASGRSGGGAANGAAGGSIVIDVSGGSGGMSGSTFKACAQPSDCPATELCVEGTCRPTAGPCATDKDCLGDFRCCGAGCRTDGSSDGVCVPNDGVDKTCKKDSVALGVFAPSLQCQWAGPSSTDPFPSQNRVIGTPIVADLPNDSGAAAEILIIATDESAGAERGNTVWDPRIDLKTGLPVDPRYGQPSRGGVLRILNGQTCEQVEVITTGSAETNTYIRAPSTPAVADLDGDGTLEIVARTQAFDASGIDDASRIIAFKWNAGSKKFEQFWLSDAGTGGIPDNASWDGVSLHDLDGDGKPEVIARHGAVFDGLTGKTRAAFDASLPVLTDPVVGDVDLDGKVELIAGQVYEWTGSGWSQKYPGAGGYPSHFYAFADFGTPGATPEAFDYAKLDGKAEIVTTGGPGGEVGLFTLSGQKLLSLALGSAELGGPPTIGDFDHDGFPELASAGATAYRVFDPECQGAGNGCKEKFVRWAQTSQDMSGQTGSSIFDFEGDGKAEAVYADECFLRVYEGATGEVLFSAFRVSCTWVENPVIADTDKDTRTEIVVNSNINCQRTCPEVDPIDRGVRCATEADCVTKKCDQGFCRCGTDSDCGNDFVPDPSHPSRKAEGLGCVAPLPGTPGSGNVCRALHPASLDGEQQYGFNTVLVYRDVLDRWADSRPLWNQYNYSITNIEDDGRIPATKDWEQNFATPGLNNYRQNRQGLNSANLLPDITGGLDQGDVCQIVDGVTTLTAKVCNRGLRVVGANMPATFYAGPPSDGKVLCVSYTQGPVQLGNTCLPVTCQIDGGITPGSEVYMVVNDDGEGHATTEECKSDNNTDRIEVKECRVPK